MSWTLVASRPDRSNPDRCRSRISVARSLTGTSRDCERAAERSGGDGGSGRSTFARLPSLTTGEYSHPSRWTRACRSRYKATPRELPGLATALIRSRTIFCCSLLSSSATAVTHPRLVHLPHSSASTAMACSTWMPTIGRATTDPCSQDADTDNARSVTSNRSRQIDTGKYVLPSQSTCGATSTGQAVTTIPNNAARQREAMVTSRILPRPEGPSSAESLGVLP